MRRTRYWKAYRTMMWFMHGTELAAHNQMMVSLADACEYMSELFPNNQTN